MPKKAATARNGAQRNKAKTQKSFEVVRQNAGEQEFTEDAQIEITPISAPVPSAATAATSRPARSARRATQRAAVATSEVEMESEIATPEVETESTVVTTPVAKGNASARLAARRGQKGQQRTAATLITSDHYAYVTRDLMIIAVLASVMFVAIIVLYFTMGR